jgi:peptide chain release factor subunit 1
MVREIEPLKPLRTGMYYCDGQFHVEPLLAQLSDETSYGFVIFDGSGCHMYNVSGDSYNLVWKHGDPALPKKHGRGGQSAPRFGRLRDIARAAWVSLVAKQLNVAFTDKSSGNVEVAGIVLCGSGELKQQLYLRTNILSERVQSAIIPTLVDLQYGGVAGIQEAIKRASPLIKDHAHSAQKGIMTSFMEAIAQGDGQVAFGPTDTMHALQDGAVATLLISESLSYHRVVYRNLLTDQTEVEYLEEDSMRQIPPVPRSVHREVASEHSWASAPAQASSSDHDTIFSFSSSSTFDSIDREILAQWKVESVEPLLDHLFQSVSSIGVSVQLISSSSALGSQFAGAFGGIGALLRYPIPLPSQEVPDDEQEDDGDFDFDF